MARVWRNKIDLIIILAIMCPIRISNVISDEVDDNDKCQIVHCDIVCILCILYSVSGMENVSMFVHWKWIRHVVPTDPVCPYSLHIYVSSHISPKTIGFFLSPHLVHPATIEWICVFIYVSFEILTFVVLRKMGNPFKQIMDICAFMSEIGVNVEGKCLIIIFNAFPVREI